MPDPLSTAPGEAPRLSRWARTAIARWDWTPWSPVRGATATRLTSSSLAAAGDVGREGLPLDRELVLAQLGLDPVGRAGSRRGSRASGRGSVLASSLANCTAVDWSKNGRRRGSGSGSGSPTLNAATRRGTATTSQAAR